MFEYFYNEILRRTIIGFGTLFNSISIKQDGSPLRVPLAYGPTQKFLARLNQSPDLNKATSLSLPRTYMNLPSGLTCRSSSKAGMVVLSGGGSQKCVRKWNCKSLASSFNIPPNAGIMDGPRSAQT